MLCGGAPICIFPHSGIQPSSQDHLPHLDHDCRHRKKIQEEENRSPKSASCIYCCLIKEIFTFQMCRGWGVFSLPLSGEGEE